jgi:hypothetical protein
MKQALLIKSWWGKPLEKSIRRWEGISKDFRDIGCEQERWIELALHHVQSQGLVLDVFQVLLPLRRLVNYLLNLTVTSRLESPNGKNEIQISRRLYLTVLHSAQTWIHQKHYALQTSTGCLVQKVKTDNVYDEKSRSS